MIWCNPALSNEKNNVSEFSDELSSSDSTFGFIAWERLMSFKIDYNVANNTCNSAQVWEVMHEIIIQENTMSMVKLVAPWLWISFLFAIKVIVLEVEWDYGIMCRVHDRI